MMTSQIFEELYNKLNPEQKRAVDVVEGPVMVVAGPGTGKTQILTLRIANILRVTDTNPENILALTFTEAAAANMRRRLAEIIGSPAYAVVINTFHGFCNDIIKKYPEEFPKIIGAEHASEIEQVKIVESLIESLPLKTLKPFGEPFYYLGAVLANINTLKREGVGVADFAAIVGEERKNFDAIDDLYYETGAHKGKMKGKYIDLQKQIAKNEELAQLYAGYEGRLREQKKYDWSDMIMEVAGAMASNKNLLLLLQEAHQYILVDEHQDTNNAQNMVLEFLCNFHPSPNLFIVGDEKQAIFRFQGASLQNFLYFKNIYPAAELITLQENYRSTQSILDSAHQLFAQSKRLTAKVLHPERVIAARVFPDLDSEMYGVARDIAEKIQAGVASREIAVLYRDNRDAFPVAQALYKQGVGCVIESDEDILSDRDVKKIMMILRAVVNFGNSEFLVPVLHIDFLNIPPIEAYKIMERASLDRISMYDVCRSTGVSEAARDVYHRLSSWAAFAKNHAIQETLAVVARESGLVAKILKGADAFSALGKISALFDEAQSLERIDREAGLSEFLAHMDAVSGHRLLIKNKADKHLLEGVRLLTAHRAKGLEFDYVYIVNVTHGHWGGRRHTEKIKLPMKVFALRKEGELDGGADDDERRLFYVALTRARKEAVVTYFKTGPNGEEELPSQFIGEIKAEAQEGEAMPREAIFAEPVLTKTDARDQELVKNLFNHYGFSVTMLNNYLACPWKYFYNNLLRIPKAKERHQLYGSAIHAALKDFFDARKNGADKIFLLQKFEYHLRKETLREGEFAEFLERGKTALGGYYDKNHSLWGSDVLTEFGIKGVLLAPEIRLTGKIDKMMFAENRDVVVVDYKTGKPKTRGEIEGTTKSSRGDIKRQLVFYNLLLNLYENGKYKMAGGEIDFIEPNEKGDYKKESFVILPEEVGELKELIKKVSAEILSLDFWNKRCEEKDCEFCALREMMG